MFSLAIEGDDGELYYWSGGEIWSVRPEEAARFVQETDAEATIDMLKKPGGIFPRPIYVLRLPEGLDDLLRL